MLSLFRRNVDGKLWRYRLINSWSVLVKQESEFEAMKVKTRHKKSSGWKRKANSSPIAKGRKAKRKGRNPGKMKHVGGRGL